MSRFAMAVVLLTGCAVQHPIVLEIDTSSPLACVDRTTQTLVVSRAFAPEHQHEDVLLVFDFVRTPTFPRCRPETIAQECAASGGCDAVPEARACLRVPRAEIDALDVTIDELRVSDLVHGTPQILGDAPDGTVVVRLAIVLDGADDDPCPAEGELLSALPRFDPSRVLGCGYSCPVVLEEESIVEIDLDPIITDRICDESYVQACAAIGL